MQYQLPQRPTDGHKGTFGKVLVVAGSAGMSGAACLTGCAALRSGAGLVMIAVPQSIQSVVAGFEPSCTTDGLPCDDGGRLTSSAVDRVLELLSGRDAVAVGPGLGQSPAVTQVVRGLIQHTDVPLVLDADALNTVAVDQLSLQRTAPTVVTPHLGEFTRLTGRSSEDVKQHRRELAQQYAAQHGVVVVLKGAGTVVTDGDRVVINSTGNSGMATGGSGDVLTGVIAALCGQGMRAYEAAVSAVYAHGLAGDIAAAAGSQRGLIASDLLQSLPSAWARIEADVASE